MHEYPDSSAPWSLSDIPYEQIDRERLRGRQDLFYMVTAASMIESGSDLYTSNLVAHFAGDTEASDWLVAHWERDELRHGRALRAYVECAWPQFPWQRAFDSFFGEYRLACSTEALEPSRALEMAARCVVETGTASLYRAMQSMTDEPVLQALATRLHHDEVRHYKHFYRYFQRLNALERNSRWAVLRCEIRRLLEIRNDDTDIAIRHVHAACSDEGGSDETIAQIRAQVSQLIRQHLPREMTVKMLLRPLSLPPRMQPVVQKSLTVFTDKVMLS